MVTSFPASQTPQQVSVHNGGSGIGVRLGQPSKKVWRTKISHEWTGRRFKRNSYSHLQNCNVEVEGDAAVPGMQSVTRNEEDVTGATVCGTTNQVNLLKFNLISFHLISNLSLPVQRWCRNASSEQHLRPSRGGWLKLRSCDNEEFSFTTESNAFSDILTESFWPCPRVPATMDVPQSGPDGRLRRSYLEATLRHSKLEWRRSTPRTAL